MHVNYDTGIDGLDAITGILDLSKCLKINIQGVQTLAKYLKNAKELDLMGLPNFKGTKGDASHTTPIMNNLTKYAGNSECVVYTDVQNKELHKQLSMKHHNH